MGGMQQIPGGVGSMADDEAALKRGKGGMIAALIVIGLVVIGGLLALMGGGDQARVYGDLGRKINGLRQASFDQFWGCALPNAVLKDIKSNTELISQLDGRAAEGKAAYAVHLRDKCLPKLDDIEPQLDTLIVPADLKTDVDGMKAASSKLRGSLSALISYLDNPELKYDTDSARVYFDNIARGWFEFRQAHGAVNKTLKAKLETQ
jgi:hypothetical protein